MGKTQEGRVNGEDRISELPDEIIATILSRLSSKYATRTCLLSKRWRYLWTQVRYLNFDIPPAGWKSYCWICCQRTGEECEHGVKFKSVTQFFRLHQGTLDRITMSVSPTGYHGTLCRETLSKIIPAWIELVVPKRVQSLEIDLYNCGHYEYDQVYLLEPFQSPLGVSCIKYLKQLSLKGPGIRGEIVEHFLSNSPLLEHLSISGSTNLKVFGSSSLKFLQISDCEFLDPQVEISAPNLVSFVYSGISRAYPILNH
ncbi:hypothetical protein ACLB2K_010283 [Fragaria x ananassa]